MIRDRLPPWVGRAITRFKLRGCTSIGASPRVRGILWIHGEGRIDVGDRVFFDAASAPIELYAWEGASLVIGDDCYLGGGTSIEATSSIVLGARAHLGAFCKVMDNHFHALVGDRHAPTAPRPVRLEEDVALGARTIVLAGAQVARGTRAESGTIIGRGPRGAPVEKSRGGRDAGS